MARDAMGPDKLAEVVEFFRRERLLEEKEAQQERAMDEGDYMAAAMAVWTTPFLPNLLNTCVFLVETTQHVSACRNVCRDGCDGCTANGLNG